MNLLAAIFLLSLAQSAWPAAKAATGYATTPVPAARYAGTAASARPAAAQQPAVPVDEKAYNCYLGETHNHSQFSFDFHGGEQGSEPIDAYKTARDEAKMDFFTIADHNFGKLTTRMFHRGYEQARSMTENGKFVAIYAIEFNKGMTESGHSNLLDAPVMLGWEQHEVFVGLNNWNGYYEAALEHPGQYGTVAQYNHPLDGNFNNMGYTEEADKAMQLAEVSNGYADSLDTYEANIQQLLANGFHLGFTASDDWHDLGWGNAKPETTGVLAKELTKKDIMTALRKRRTYGMNDTNAKVWFRLGSSVYQGAQAVSRSSQLQFHLKVADYDDEGVESVTWWGGPSGGGELPKELARMEGKDTQINNFSWVIHQPRKTTWYYYPKIIQNDGNFIMVSPIWVRTQ